VSNYVQPLTPGELAAARRHLDEIADADAKKVSPPADTISPIMAFIDDIIDQSIDACDTVAVIVPEDQFELLRLYYIRRRVHLEIDRREEKAIDLRVEENV